MAIQDWLNAPVIGGATVGDIGKSAMDFYNTYQTNQGRQDATDTIVEGYDAGIGKINQLAGDTRDVIGGVYDTSMENIQPYLGAGKTSLDHYMGLTQDPSTIMEDPAAQWRYKMGLEATKRDLEGAGYADPMGSGARPRGITEYGQGFASQELDRALARDLPIIGYGADATRTGVMAGDSYQRGMADINKYQGNQLVDLYTGRANAQSTKSILDSMAMSDYLKGATGLLNQAAGNNDVMSLIASALGGGTTADGASLWEMLGESFGFDAGDSGIIDQAIDFLSGGGDTMLGTGTANQALTWGVGGLDDALGPNNILNTTQDADFLSKLKDSTGIDFGKLFGGGTAADTMLGTGTANEALTWGTGGLDAAMGGGAGSEFTAAMSNPATAESLASAATSSFGSWATYAAGGLGGIFALRGAMQLLNSKKPDYWGDALSGAVKADDPLSYINSLPADKLPKQTYTNQYDSNLTTRQAKGALYSSVLQNMSPEAIQSLKYHEDIGSVVNSMIDFVRTGSEIGGKHSEGGDATSALKMLFPEIGTNIDMLYAGKQTRNLQERMTLSGDPHAGSISDWQSDQLQRKAGVDAYYAMQRGTSAGTYTENANVIKYIQNQISSWEAEKIQGEASLGVV